MKERIGAYFRTETEEGEVRDVPENYQDFQTGVFYRVNDTIYPYLGDAGEDKRIVHYYQDNYDGGIYLYQGVPKIIEWSREEDRQIHNIKHMEARAKKDTLLDTPDPVSDLENYVNAYQSGRNLSRNVKIQDTSTGSVYIPKFREEDNAVEQLLKKMIVAMKVVSSEYRKKMSEEYKYDNLVSSLDGATKHTSIAKIVEWFKLLELDWEFTVFNVRDDVSYPLASPITVSNKDDHWVTIDPAPYAPEIYLVPLTEGEDPYKRLIKLALFGKMIPKAEYRKKGATSHQINNLMSALRNKQKMASEYFEIWCELLGLEWNIRLTDPKSGIWYNAIGQDITTNYEGEEESS